MTTSRGQPPTGWWPPPTCPDEKTTYLNHSLWRGRGAHVRVHAPGQRWRNIRPGEGGIGLHHAAHSPEFSNRWNNVSVMTWPPSAMDAHFGLNTQWSAVDHNGSNASWPTNQPSPTLGMNNSTLVLDLRIPRSICAGFSNGTRSRDVPDGVNTTPSTVVRVDGAVKPFSQAPTP